MINPMNFFFLTFYTLFFLELNSNYFNDKKLETQKQEQDRNLTVKIETLRQEQARNTRNEEKEQENKPRTREELKS